MVKIWTRILTINFLLFNVSFAYQPTLESLLRNGSNPDIGNNTVLANLIVKDLSVDNKLNANSEITLTDKHAIKLHIFNEKENDPILTRIYYKAGLINQNSLLNYKEGKLYNLKRTIGTNENLDAEVFYGLMSYLLNNEGLPLIEALKKVRPTLKQNNELIDPEKIDLLAKYKNYLVQVKEAEEEQEVELENPLSPKEDEAKLKVKEVMKRSFLVKDQEVKRVKKGKDFIWVVDGENLYMEFDKNHYLREVKLMTTLGEIQIVLGKYGIWGAQMQFPEFIMFKTSDQRWYEIKPAKVTMFKDNLDLYKRRLKKYDKAIEENKLTDPQIRPAFML